MCLFTRSPSTFRQQDPVLAGFLDAVASFGHCVFLCQAQTVAAFREDVEFGGDVFSRSAWKNRREFSTGRSRPELYATEMSWGRPRLPVFPEILRLSVLPAVRPAALQTNLCAFSPEVITG